jgi:hypothetical protein
MSRPVKAKAIEVKDTKTRDTRIKDIKDRVIKIRDTAMIPRNKPIIAVGRAARIAVTLAGVGLPAAATHPSKARDNMLKGQRTNKIAIGVGSTQIATLKIKG